jgi:threonine dehydrogenase-like Zn-dependent dehydrogenase
MRAALLYGINDLRLEDISLPVFGDDEILVKIIKSFICGTDIRMLKNGYKYASSGNGLVIGHEFSGVIEKTGKKVIGYSEGDRVFVAPNIGCGSCLYCISGNSHMCNDYKAFGVHFDGGFDGIPVVDGYGVGLYQDMNKTINYWVKPKKKFYPDLQLHDLYTQRFAKYSQYIQLLSRKIK